MLRPSLLVLLCVTPAAAQFPEGYVDETVVSGLTGAVSLVHDANGRMYVLERRGMVHVVENDALLSPPLLDISDEVGAWSDLGMLGLVLDPDFLGNGHFYVSYVVDRHHLLHFGTPWYDPGTNQYQEATIGRITRYTADPGTGFTSLVDGSRHVLLGQDAQSGFPILSRSHGTGGLAFGADGTLLAGAGDGASFYAVDSGSLPGTYYAQALADGIIRPAENVGAFRAQQVNSLSGKLLRIDPTTGDGIPSNPFYDPADPGATRSRVWALGLRNPFRFTVRPGTGQADPAAGDPGVIYVGDVGWDRFEELHVLGERGMNLGWPIFEGLVKHPDYAAALTANLDAPNPLHDGLGCSQEFFTFQDLLKQEREDHDPGFPNPCNEAVEIAPSTPTFMHRRAQLEWRHGGGPAANVPVFNRKGLAIKSRLGDPDCPVHGESFNGSCSVGGVWLSGLGFGEPYSGSYFLGDWTEGWLRALEFEDDDSLHEVFTFGQVTTPSFLGEDPLDGSLLYVQWGQVGTGSVHRVRFTGDGNVGPQVVTHIDADPSSSSFTSVRLDATSSVDPEGGLLEFLWELEDGTSSTSPSPLLSFHNPGGAPAHREVELHVTDPSGATGSAHLHVQLDNTAPSVSVVGATNGEQYSSVAETTFELEAHASDAEHDEAELSYLWKVSLHHANHDHPDDEQVGSSAEISLAPTPCDGEFYAYRVDLTVRDPEGLEATETLWFFPDCSQPGSAEITSPAAGEAIDLGDTLAVQVDTTGAVTHVDLYTDGSFAGTSFTPPHTFKVSPEAAGTTMINAVAHIEGEGVVTSPGAPVVVHAPQLREQDVRKLKDDAQELPDGTVTFNQPVLDLGTAGSTPALVGVRLALDVPQGARIFSAHLQFTAQAVEQGAARLRVRAEASDDAAQITPTSGSLSSRATTGARVTWLPQPWSYAGARGWRERTSDLATVLQEVVDRPGWQAGNHVLLLIDGSGRRPACAHTPTGSEAPRLVVRFTD